MRGPLIEEPPAEAGSMPAVGNRPVARHDMAGFARVLA
jgi:hypothetical protein